jgi:adenylate cyclase
MEMVDETRHAVAVHGDGVGYSRLIADNEIETHNTLQAFRRIIDEVVTDNGGDLVQFVGDEFLAILPAETEGLSAAIEIQRRLAAENLGLPDGRKLRFRIGVNAGDISVADGGWYGDAINVAARLQALAEPGGVNASRWTLDAAEGVTVKVESLGDLRLKNIPEPVPAFRIVDAEAEDVGEKPWRRRIPVPTKPSLAVSPFVNFGAEEDRHFADGLMMALTISLMRIPGVDVISELSTLGYRDRAFSAQQLGHELGVKYVLEGATQRAGGRVRVMTQLLDVDEGTTVWADRFEASLNDVFAAQDDIVNAIVAALDVEVIGRDVARMYRSEVSPEAVDLLYRGLSEMAMGAPENLRRAAEMFDSVIDMEPDSPSGYTLSAMVNNWMAMFEATDDPAGAYARAEDRALRANELGDESGIAQTVLAHIRILRHDWDGALEAVEEATSLRPSCDLTYGVAASVMRYLGKWEEAVDFSDRAARLSPLFTWWYRSIRANAELIGGNYETAADVAEGVVAEDKTDVESLLTLAAAQSALGRARHAAAAVDHLRRTRPGITTDTLRSNLPYRDEAVLAKFLGQLEAAGLE